MYMVLTHGLNEDHPTTSVSARLVYMVCDGHLYPNLNETIKFACTKWGAKNLYDNLASLKWTCASKFKPPPKELDIKLVGKA